MSSTPKRLTLEQMSEVAAREVGDGERVYLGPDLSPLLRAKLPAQARIVGAETFEAVDVVFLRAQCVTPDGRLCTPSNRVNGSDPYAHIPAAKNVVVLLEPGKRESAHGWICGHGGATGPRAHRLITQTAVLDVRREGLLLRGLAPGVSARDVQAGCDSGLLADHTLDELDI